MSDSPITNDQRRFPRVDCRFIAEFRLSREGTEWLRADVLDLTIAGIRVRFDREQHGRVLNEADIEWKEACFRFGPVSQALLLKGHFLMVYERRDGRFTTGVEFVDVTPEQQIQLVRLYADHRREGPEG